MRDRPHTFQEVLSAAIADLVENGFDSVERVARWTRELREAARRSMISPTSLEQQLRDALAAIYRRMVDQGAIFRYAPGIERFTLERVRPMLRAELDRRIAASADLIKLNREEAIEKTIRRFQGWATSIPQGGTEAANRTKVKQQQRKALASLPFEERRVLIDQGHKLTSALSEILASDGGAIAGRWRSNWRQPGYDYRDTHKERDQQVYLVRDSWAHRAGLVKPQNGYVDDVTRPAEEPFCFPGDSRVPFVDGAEKAYRRWYSGQLAEIVTVSGKTLRSTPNHPVLTPNGWVAIGLLQEGDHVVEIGREVFDEFEEDQHETIPTIADVFRSIAEIGVQSTREGQFEQFHGDGTNADVDVVAAARPLTFDSLRKPTAPKFLDQLRLAISKFRTAASRTLFAFHVACARAGACLMRGVRQALPAGFAFAGHPHESGFAPAARRAASSLDLIADHLSGDAELSGEGQDALASLMPLLKFARIERARRVDFSGHVFNLQTRTGWYVTEGIITHNCRCYYVWLHNLRDLPAEMLTAKGKHALSSAQGQEEVRSARTARGDEAGGDDLARARAVDRLGWLTGLTGLVAGADDGGWHADYDDGPDTITLRPKFFDLPAPEQLHVLLHEIGHRGQAVAPAVYRDFKREHLDQLASFRDMANEEHLEDFERRGVVDGGLATEVFAEGYARAALGLPMPAELRAFWSRRFVAAGLTTQRDTAYTPTWPNRITRCQRCSMFLRINAGLVDNACSAVEGKISGHGHCRLFEIIGARAAA